MNTPMPLYVRSQTIIVTDPTRRNMPYEMGVILVVQQDGFPVGLAVEPICDVGYGSFTARPDDYTVTLFHTGLGLLVLPIPAVWAPRPMQVLVAGLNDWAPERDTARRDERQGANVALARVQTPEESKQVFSALHPPALPATFALDALPLLLDWTFYGMEFVRRLWHCQTKTVLASLQVGHAEAAGPRPETTTTTGERP